MPNLKTGLHDAALVLAVAAATCLGVAGVLGSGGQGPLSAAFAENGAVFIGHALGGVNGKTYTNSREAFLQSVRDGRRLLEADLQMLQDDVGVVHDDELGVQMGIAKRAERVTREEFLAGKVYGAFTPLTWGQLLDLMTEHPGIVVITDTKDDIGVMYRVLVRQARERDPKLLDRIVPQMYAPQDLERLNAIHRFPAVIFTLYRTDLDDEGVLAFVRANPQVSAVTMSEQRFSAFLAEAVRREGRDAFVHTLNDAARMARFMELGATGIYTDFLLADHPRG